MRLFKRKRYEHKIEVIKPTKNDTLIVSLPNTSPDDVKKFKEYWDNAIKKGTPSIFINIEPKFTLIRGRVKK